MEPGYCVAQQDLIYAYERIVTVNDRPKRESLDGIHAPAMHVGHPMPHTVFLPMDFKSD